MTVAIIRMNEMTERVSQLEKSIFLYNVTTSTIVIICAILATVSAILTCFIHRYSCSGSCKIPAIMKLAEKTMPSGKPRTKYGFAV